RRREFMKGAALATGALLLGGCVSPGESDAGDSATLESLAKLDGVTRGKYTTDEKQNEFKDVTRYNNFYEFGTGKHEPAENAHQLVTKPWSVTIDGAVEKPGTLALEDFLKPHTLEERVYRMRCVEAWSMVIPWIGIPLSDVLRRFGPMSNAKYAAFQTLYDP